MSNKLIWKDYHDIICKVENGIQLSEKEQRLFKNQIQMPANPSIPILCPVKIGMRAPSRGKFVEFKKSRYLANAKSKTLFNKAEASVPLFYRDEFNAIRESYFKFFEGQDSVNTTITGSILDFGSKRPVMYMFYLEHENWSFTGHKQFQVGNDSPHNPTCRQVSCFDGMRGIIVENSCQVEHRLKYDLFVTIAQEDEDRGQLTTDIIIDPGMNSDDIGDP